MHNTITVGNRRILFFFCFSLVGFSFLIKAKSDFFVELTIDFWVDCLSRKEIIYLTSLAVALLIYNYNNIEFITKPKKLEKGHREELEYRTDTWFGVGLFLHRSHGFVKHFPEVEFLLSGTFYQWVSFDFVLQFLALSSCDKLFRSMYSEVAFGSWNSVSWE